MKGRIGDAIVRVLEQEGVEIVFGLPGSQVQPVYDALYDSPIRSVLVRHEQAAAVMADAYAKATGKLGVCLSTNGPGALNLVTGVFTSYTDSIPVLVLTGQHPIRNWGKGSLHECDHNKLFAGITKWSTTLLEPKRAVSTIQEAIRVATSGRPGPVHIDLPLDILLQEIEFELPEPILGKIPYYCAAPEHEVERAVEILLNAKAPVMLIGGGVQYAAKSAEKEALQLVETLRMPFGATFNGLGALPSNHELSIGRVGWFAQKYTKDILWNSDCILAVGCRFSGPDTANWTLINPDTKIIQIDIDPAIVGKNYPITVGLVGDAKSVLQQMNVILGYKGSEVAAFKEKTTAFRKKLMAEREIGISEWDVKANQVSVPLLPQYVCRVLRNALPKDAIITGDSGNIHFWPVYEPIYQTRTWINSGAGAAMGYSIPAAVACKLAYPDRDVIAIVGDGGFYMTGEELITSYQEKAPIITVILNNSSLGFVKHSIEEKYNNRYINCDFVNPDFATISRANYGFGAKVERPEELETSIKDALGAVRNGIPALLDIVIDPNEKLPK